MVTRVLRDYRDSAGAQGGSCLESHGTEDTKTKEISNKSGNNIAENLV